MTTEAYNQKVVDKLKPISDKAWAEITNPKYKEARKKALLSTLILSAALAGCWFSFIMMGTGLDILLESGVSEVLVLRIEGIVVCLGGFFALKIVIRDTPGALRRVIYGEEKKCQTSQE